MSKKNYTHIISIIDTSGSMYSIEKDMEGGFNAFIKEQKELEGDATLTLVEFSNENSTIHNNIPVSDFDSFTLRPGGSTALLDAIGDTLSEERTRMSNMDDNNSPEKVICIIITDGQENSSKKYERERIFEMISDLQENEDPQWDFVFLGANQDAIAEGGNLGIRQNASLTYNADSEGTRAMFCSLSSATASYRSSSVGETYSFSEDDRQKQNQNEKSKKDIDFQKKIVEAKFGKPIPTKIEDL